MPRGVRVEMKGVGHAIWSDLPGVSKTRRGWLTVADIAADERFEKQIGDLDGGELVDEEGMQRLDVPDARVEEGSTGRCGLREPEIFDDLRLELFPGESPHRLGHARGSRFLGEERRGSCEERHESEDRREQAEGLRSALVHSPLPCCDNDDATFKTLLRSNS
jgi:hypothetical protein